jgi:lysophospholipase L1-like esterase
MTNAATKARKFGPVKTVVFSTILVVLFFAAAELALRVGVSLFRSPAERFDFLTGTFVLVPGAHPRIGAPPIEINSRGFVGPEFREPRAPGVTRIVTVGDSCTFGQGSGVETYPQQLSLRLNGHSEPPHYQVINAAIEGLNSELALRRFETKVAPLKPDIVTVYLGWNDLMKFDPSGQVEHPGLGIIARAIDQLWLVKAMRKVIFYSVRPNVSAPATGPASRTGAFRDYRPSVFENNLHKIIQAARADGAKVAVMTLPSVVSADMTPDDLRRANVVFPYYSSAYAVGDYVDLIAAYNGSIRTVARAEGVQLVDLADEIDGRPDRRKLFLDTMHANQRGRELIADILAQHLRDSGLVAGRADSSGGRPGSTDGRS